MDLCALFTHNSDGISRGPSSLIQSVSQPDTAASFSVLIPTLTQLVLSKEGKQARGYMLFGS